jgi:hypothetical protein
MSWAILNSTRGNDDAVVMLAGILIKYDGERSIKRTMRLRHHDQLLEAAQRRYPSADYVLGCCAEFGRLAQPQNMKIARDYYVRGWEAHTSLACAVALRGSAEDENRPHEVKIWNQRITRFCSSTQAEVEASASASGSLSLLNDALWSTALYLEERENEDVGEEEMNAAGAESIRLLEMCAARGDAHASAKRAKSLCRPEIRGFHFVVRDAEGEAHIQRLLSGAYHGKKKAAGPVSTAHSISGSFASDEGDEATARRHYLKAVSVCEDAGDTGSIDHMALVHLPMMLFEALGGPRDIARGEEILKYGVENRCGPALVVAAQRAHTRGDKVEATRCWELAAAAKMPEAVAVMSGLTLEEAAQRTLGPFGKNVSVTKGLGAIADPLGVPGVEKVPWSENLYDRFRLRCAGCGRRGRLMATEEALRGGKEESADEGWWSAENTDINSLPMGTLIDRLRAVNTPVLPLLDVRMTMMSAMTGQRVPAIDGEGAAVKTAEDAGIEAGRARLASALKQAVGTKEALEKNLPTLLQCSQCLCAFYCNRACQKMHWHEHKKTCKENKARGEETPRALRP